MTVAASAHKTAPHMAHTPDPIATPQAQAMVSAVEPGAARPRLRDQIAENPLLSLFGGVIVVILTLFGTALVALMIFALTSIHNRIDGLEARLDRLEVKVDAGFAAQGAQIAELDARLTGQIAELERKLTALIAHLNATAAVDAALEHRLVIPEAGDAEPEGGPPG